jgi:hypothetical protein
MTKLCKRRLVMKKIGIALLLMGWTGSALANEVWTVIEGGDGNFRGTWSLISSGEELKGSALMYDSDGEKLSYSISGRGADGIYKFERVGASDSRACSYEGRMETKDVITGSMICGSQTGPWRATQLHN